MGFKLTLSSAALLSTELGVRPILRPMIRVGVLPLAKFFSFAFCAGVQGLPLFAGLVMPTPLIVNCDTTPGMATDLLLVEQVRVELTFQICRTSVLPLNYSPKIFSVLLHVNLLRMEYHPN